MRGSILVCISSSPLTNFVDQTASILPCKGMALKVEGIFHIIVPKPVDRILSLVVQNSFKNFTLDKVLGPTLKLLSLGWALIHGMHYP